MNTKEEIIDACEELRLQLYKETNYDDSDDSDEATHALLALVAALSAEFRRQVEFDYASRARARHSGGRGNASR